MQPIQKIVKEKAGYTPPSGGGKGAVRLLEAAVLAGTAYTQYQNLKQNVRSWKRRRGYTVNLISTDSSFYTVMKALLRLMPDLDQKYINLVSERELSGDLTVHETWDALRSQTVVIDGHEIEIGLLKPDEGKGGGGSTEGNDLASLLASMKPDTLYFWSKTHAGKVAVVNFMNRVVAEEHATTPKIYVYSRWGDWRDHSDVPRRSLDSVILKKGVAEDIRHDLESFLAQEQDYSRMGLPWHRGYLLHGCPGSGKTSAVRALACEMNLDLYVVNLPSIRDDNTLMTMFSNVQPRSAILIEDVDTAAMARDRDRDKEGGVTTSGLLNALDGVSTPHGLIVFMTSNRKNTLDEALLRPGRCDRTFKINYLDNEQLARMVKVYVGETPDLPPVPKKLAPATVIELYKEHLNTPENFVPALITMLENYDA